MSISLEGWRMAKPNEQSGSKAKKTNLVAKRSEQSQDAIHTLEILQTHLATLDRATRQLLFFQSVESGLYLEIDKLTKKAPAEEVTHLLLKHVNDLIRQTKVLLAHDDYMKGLVQFVPAGDNPQYRDVILVLRQIHQALDRFKTSLSAEAQRTRGLIEEADTIQIATALFVHGNTKPTKGDVANNIEEVSSKWFIDGHPYTFRFDKLDSINTTEYFAISEMIEEGEPMEGRRDAEEKLGVDDAE
jgi:hypothetical protein